MSPTQPTPPHAREEEEQNSTNAQANSKNTTDNSAETATTTTTATATPQNQIGRTAESPPGAKLKKRHAPPSRLPEPKAQGFAAFSPGSERSRHSR